VLTLYWFWSPSPQKARLALEELGLEYTLVTVDLTQGGHYTDLVGALNPNRRVPILRVDDYTLWESNAILTYLGERCGRLWPGDAEGKGQAAQWLFYESSHLSRPVRELWLNGFLARVMNRTPDTVACERAEQESARHLAVLERHLGRSEWMLGAGFSLVDCCYGPLLDALALSGTCLDRYPALQAYLDRMRGRPAWRACGFKTGTARAGAGRGGRA
jgi:GST-like protein